MAIIFLIFGLILVGFDLYILLGVIPGCTLPTKGLLLLPTLAYIIVLVCVFIGANLRQNMLNLLFWLTLCVVFTTLIFCIFSLIGKGIGLFWPTGFRIFNFIGLAAGAVWLCISL